MSEAKRVAAVAEELSRRLPGLTNCRLALVLGSGLGAFADGLDDAQSVDYADVEGIPSPSVPGHSGRLVVGKVDGKEVAVLQGRVHLYEGHPPAVVVRAVRSLVRAGVNTVVLTNAAGAIAEGRTVGDLVLISDHINFTGQNPLVGDHEEELGLRFADLTDLYSAELRERVHAAASAEGIDLGEGVYATMLGPSYETPAEIRMARAAGAELVGMSTVPEAIAAHAMGARVVAMSFVTNIAAGLGEGGLAHAEVTEAAEAMGEELVRALGVIVSSLHEPSEAPR